MEDVDIELFIEEVKKFPEIWNIAAEEFHDKFKKRNAWIRICQVFSEGFDEKEDKEKNHICNSFIKKWRNIKDNFLRSVKKKTKSGQRADSGRRYIYARQLSFLLQARSIMDTQSSLEDGHAADPEQLDDQESAQTGETIERPQRGMKRKQDLEPALVHFMDTPSSSTSTPEPNEDRLFFESILPSIKDFSIDQKLEFRCEVLNLVKRMRMITPDTGIFSQQHSVSLPMHLSHFPMPHSPNRFVVPVSIPGVSPTSSSSSSTNIKQDDEC